MAYSILLRVWAWIPKWALVGAVACFFAYYTGVNHGRAPYELAAKIQDARAAIIIKRTDKIRDVIRQKGKEADETIEIDGCVISDADARKLSDIKAN